MKSMLRVLLVLCVSTVSYGASVFNPSAGGTTGTLTNESDTLATVLARGNNAAGQSATNFADIAGTKRMTLGSGFVLSDIAASAVGARMMGAASGTQTIGANSAGSEMNGLNQGTRVIGSTLFGAYQNGWNTGVQIIDPNSHGSEQSGWNSGSMAIGQDAPGSMQRGQVDSSAGAINNATAALQLFDLAAGQRAMTTANGDASILLGAGTSSNKNAIVAGDGQESHGDGSITAGGGFYGNGAGITNVTAAQVGAVATNNARYLAALTNGGATLVAGTDISLSSTSLTNGASITISYAGGGSTGGISAATASNITAGIMATGTAYRATTAVATNDAKYLSATFWFTNTVTITNSLDWAIPLPASNVRIKWMSMFLSATNEVATTKRLRFAIHNRADRLCDGNSYLDTNQLYWTAVPTTAEAAGSASNVVADTSGVVLFDRYAVGNGTTWDFLTATNSTATVIQYACTNKYAVSGDANSKISHANYLTPIYYDDDTTASTTNGSMWCRAAWTTAHTGTVTVIGRGSL